MKRVIFFLLAVPVLADAQEYIAEAPLSKVTANGFYTIPLPPKITASLESDLRNIRIIDNQEKEIPYMVSVEPQDYSTMEWTPMKIERKLRKGCCTIINIFNDKKEYVDNLLFRFKNADVYKTGTLRGSDDGETWYAVIETFQVVGRKLSIGEAIQVTEIPISNYKYYQFTIDDSTSTPINVVSIERTRQDIIHGNYVEIPDVKITSSDSAQDRETWGVIEFDTAQYVDRIEFDVEGPHLFKRSATLFRKVKGRFESITTFDIISGQGRPISVGLKEKTLYIRVNNDNNPPLKFTQVAAYQLKRSLITYLEAGRDYRIALGKELGMPNYDLEFFKDSIPTHPNELDIGALKERTVMKKAEPQPTIFTDRKYIWAAIILVGIVLATMTVRMLRDREFNEKQ